MDMGEALDVNTELMTVGISNFVSGCLGGFTGSYIFSQTIFTYRTGCRSRWIGILVALSFVAVVISTVNFLEVTPLFFLGSTLIFIGFDLGYEWLVEVRHKLLLSEYIVLLATFVAIQFLGINGTVHLLLVVYYSCL
jgi:SulP family sulfate permease